jgi:hypothetical protein
MLEHWSTVAKFACNSSGAFEASSMIFSAASGSTRSPNTNYYKQFFNFFAPITFDSTNQTRCFSYALYEALFIGITENVLAPFHYVSTLI